MTGHCMLDKTKANREAEYLGLCEDVELQLIDQMFCFVYDIFNTFFPHLSILFYEIVRFLSEMFYCKVWKFSSVYLQCLFNY